ncbi:MAG: Gfo/Idh/MocA family oxidoreductase [Kiritimatiellia bacterium]|jgi:predicted dehydrogenase
MQQKIKVGIIGLGTIGKVHADAYAHCPDAELAALCDIEAGRLAEVSAKYQVKSRFADYSDLLKTDVAAVSICVPNHLHREIAVAALRAGKHLLLEKPMALNAAQAAEIVAAQKKARKVVQVGMVWRQKPEAQLIREEVQAGRLGEIYHMRAVLTRRRGVPGLGGWFTTKALSGGGPLIDIGVHWFDLCMHLSGLWQPTRVSAMTYAKFGANMRAYKYVSMWAGPPNYAGVCDVEDYAAGLVRFGRKATLSFEIAWAANAEETTYVELIGDKGGIRAMDGKPLKIMTEREGRLADIAPQFAAGGDIFHAQAAKFLAACRGKCPPVATTAEGLTVMRLMDGVYKSAKSGQEVSL